jgi:hypothetical protein
MTAAHPTLANRAHWWLTEWNITHLHAVRPHSWDYDEWTESGNGDVGLPAATLCGTTINAIYPALGARLDGKRCPDCCLAVGIPAGTGTPANEKGPT